VNGSLFLFCQVPGTGPLFCFGGAENGSPLVLLSIVGRCVLSWEAGLTGERMFFSTMSDFFCIFAL